MTTLWLSRGLDELPPDGRWLATAEVARVDTMRFEKRRSEFLVARFTAKLTIAHALALPIGDLAALADIEVRHRPTGAPQAHVGGVPAPLAMSSTDRADRAVCVVALDARVSVGCDLELVEPRTPAFVRTYLTVPEQEAVATSTDPHLTANLLWSAKESALKVLQTGLRRDTRSVEVAFQPGSEDAWSPLVARPVEGGSFPGWWRRAGQFLLTVVADAPLPPPVAIEDPDGLAVAVPSHRWVERPGR